MRRLRSRAVLTVAATTLTMLAAVTPALATTTGPDVETSVLAADLNLLWIVLGAALVVFMQAGFAMVETGFTRARHAAHVVTTNFMVFGLGFVGFFLVGFGLAFGSFSYPGVFGMDTAVGGPLLAVGDWVFLHRGGFALSGTTASSAPVMGFFLYMVAFMDTTATIPTGSMAERWKWSSFVGWGLFCGALYYPLFAAWTWGGGWLAQLGTNLGLGLGYVDFAGSGVVHATGGAAALAGAVVLGPRLGKFAPDGTPRALPGHNVPMAMLGTFILLFGWFGFNAASTFAATDVQFAVVATNTAIAGAFGSVAALVWITRRTGRPDPTMLVNGLLAGLVAITAPCAFVAPWAAAVIGAAAGVLVIEAAWFVERRLRIDDPVGAIAVHGVNGVWGVLAVGLFADGSYGAGWNGTESTASGVTGLLYGAEHGLGQFAAQAVGAVVIVGVGLLLSWSFFRWQDRRGGIRSAPEDELAGLDLPEMGVLAYPADDLPSTAGSAVTSPPARLPG